MRMLRPCPVMMLVHGNVQTGGGVHESLARRCRGRFHEPRPRLALRMERLRSAAVRIYSSGVGGPAARATSSCLIFSTLKRWAEASIFLKTSSKSKVVAFEKRMGFTRATTKGLRYGLVR